MPHPEQAGCSPAELEARLRLSLLPGIGARRFCKLIQAFGDASSALSAPARAWAALGISTEASDARRCSQIRERVTASQRWIELEHRYLLAWDDPRYPALLTELEGAPPMIYVLGDPRLLDKPQIAVVGSRRASAPGLDTARRFSEALAKVGFVITSGLALGIDGVAHQAALDAGGHTIGVLGTGIQKLYPQRHRSLANAMFEQGSAVISEFPLDIGPQASHFPQRNRIISGLSLGVLVVEASLNSGSLITARLAAEQGREVFAIPGSIHHPQAKGCHQLIRDGALLVENIEQIIDSLAGWRQLPLVTDHNPETTTPDDPLFITLVAAPCSAEVLAHSLGRSLPGVLAGLTELELQGRVYSEAGRWFARPG